ncbi:g9452 [Coccomyxa elongata]
MRKAASTGTLKRLAEGKCGDLSSINRYQPYHMRRSGSSGGLSTAGRHKKVVSDNDLRQAGSMPAAVQRASVRTSAVAHFAPPPAMEMAEDVMEASFARGLASAECFELYGPVRKAPPLEGATALAEEASVEASVQQLPPATAQQMAACLATPFTGTDKNMGEILRSEVDRLNAEQELKTQLRYAEELRQRQGTEEEEKEEQESLLQEGGRRRVRMRRRASEELMEAQLFEEFGVASNRPPPPPEHAHSPQTRVALQSLYASMDDNANRLTLEEADISKASVDTSEAAQEDSIFPMELGEPEEAPQTFTPKGRARTLINITATSAPPLA